MLQFTLSLHANLPAYLQITFFIQVAHNFDTFYATVEIRYAIYPDQDLRLHGRVAPGQGQGSECITGHIEHMQNGNRIMSLVPLLALES